jgi:PilZ domain
MLARSQESRKNVRRRMHRDAQVVFEGHEQSIGCVVHNISNGGARLSFTAPLAVLPRTFTLVLLKDSVQRDCELVWNGRGVVGVKFISHWFDTKSPEHVSALNKHTRKGAA